MIRFADNNMARKTNSIHQSGGRASQAPPNQTGGNRSNSNSNSNQNRKSRKRRGKQRNLSDSSRSHITHAPASIGTSFKTTRPVLKTLSNGNMVVKHHALLGATNGDGNVHRIEINPGLASSFPWIDNISVLFEYYQFTKLRFTLTSASSTDTDGMSAMCFVPDAGEVNSTSLSGIMQRQNASMNSAWLPNYLDLPKCDVPRLVRHSAVGTGVDIQLYDIGFINYMYTTALTAPGYVTVEYEVLFSGARPAPSVPAPIVAGTNTGFAYYWKATFEAAAKAGDFGGAGQITLVSRSDDPSSASRCSFDANNAKLNLETGNLYCFSVDIRSLNVNTITMSSTNLLLGYTDSSPFLTNIPPIASQFAYSSTNWYYNTWFIDLRASAGTFTDPFIQFDGTIGPGLSQNVFAQYSLASFGASETNTIPTYPAASSSLNLSVQHGLLTEQIEDLRLGLPGYKISCYAQLILHYNLLRQSPKALTFLVTMFESLDLFNKKAAGGRTKIDLLLEITPDRPDDFHKLVRGFLRDGSMSVE